jgi:hypothetical protein
MRNLPMLVLLTFLIGCSKKEITLPGKDEDVNFEEHVQPIFDENCVTCHGGANPKAGMSLERGKSLESLVGVVSTGYAPALGFPTVRFSIARSVIRGFTDRVCHQRES